MKTMVIGLGPEYNYMIEDHESWAANSTKYASNHGASLISRTLIEYFNADYIDDFNHIEEYRTKYDLCVIAFATHVTEKRDVSVYTEFVKNLNIKTVAFSLGIQDYSSASSNVSTLHPSIAELLKYVINSSGYIGVRGPHTAALLMRNGIDYGRIIKIGCPTIFRPLNRNLKIEKPLKFKKPLIVFHRTMSELNRKILSGAPLLGQDFLDEVIFNESINDNQIIKKQEIQEYSKHQNGEFTLKMIKENGLFPRTYDNWFNEIKEYDFVLGARLHGCIAAIIQGIPAVMLARDIRVQEIAEFYGIPCIRYEDIGNMSIEDIFNQADYSVFNRLYSSRFDNFVKLLADLKVDSKLVFKADIPDSYIFTEEENSDYINLLFKDIQKLNLRFSQIEDKVKENSKVIESNTDRLDGFFKKLRKVPGLNMLGNLIKEK